MKIDENICIVPHCEEIILLVDIIALFCAEHSKMFFAFWSRYEVDSEVDNMLEIDEEFQKEFWNDMVNYFFIEEEHEYHRKNKKQKKWKYTKYDEKN